MKDTICTAIGIIGEAIAALFGGLRDTALQTLVIFMAIDYITGLVVAVCSTPAPRPRPALWKVRLAGRASSARARRCSSCWWPASLMPSSAAVLSVRRGNHRLFGQRGHLHRRERWPDGTAYPAAITKAIDILKQRAETPEKGKD